MVVMEVMYAVLLPTPASPLLLDPQHSRVESFMVLHPELPPMLIEEIVFPVVCVWLSAL